MKKALVITPTTGSLELIDAIISVQNQTYSNTEHLIVVDGFNFTAATDEILKKVALISPANVQVTRTDIPFNTGANGFYGHRIMAAFGHLTAHDYIFFLDQDNWYEPNHVESLVAECEKYKFDWAYSLRNIHDKDKNFICQDNCESLGRWPVYVDKESHLIDSSTYCFSQNFLRLTGHMWDYGWGADRRYYTLIKDEVQHKNYGCSSQYTLNYRLGGNEGSVQADFFLKGNEQTSSIHKGGFPWATVLK